MKQKTTEWEKTENKISYAIASLIIISPFAGGAIYLATKATEPLIQITAILAGIAITSIPIIGYAWAIWRVSKGPQWTEHYKKH